MQPYLTISIFIFALLILWLLIAVLIARTSDAGLQPADRGKHRQGYWVSVGIGIGIAIGAGIGASLEQRNKDNLRPLSELERRVQRRGMAIGLVVSVVLGLTLLIALLLRSR